MTCKVSASASSTRVQLESLSRLCNLRLSPLHDQRNLGERALAWMSLRMMSRSYILRCSGSDRVLCASEISRNSFSAASFCPGPLALSGWKRSASCLRTATSHRQRVLLPVQKQDFTMTSLGKC